LSVTQRAFSLIEVAVASAIAGVISAAAVASFAMINRQMVRMQSESLASDHAKSLVDLLVTDLQGVGGGPIRPWMATWVEDGYAPDALGRNAIFAATTTGPVRPDRITFATLVPDAPTCTITAHAGATLTASTGSDGGCCLQALLDAGRIPGTNLTNAYMILGERHRQVFLNPPSSSACTATVVPGPLSAIDNPPLAGNFSNGVIVAARVKTLYLTSGRELRLYEDRSGDGPTPTITPDETTRLAGNVADFQIQLGYDRENDGRLVDTGDGGDEWLYNVAGVENPATFRADALRMIGVGVVVALPLTDPTYRSTAQIVGSPRIDGIRLHVRGAMGKAALRNIFVFF
jgi:prepilin-type N-terminal cleavage/methylation domain-containing protein